MGILAKLRRAYKISKIRKMRQLLRSIGLHAPLAMMIVNENDKGTRILGPQGDRGTPGPVGVRGEFDPGKIPTGLHGWSILTLERTLRKLRAERDEMELETNNKRTELASLENGLTRLENHIAGLEQTLVTLRDDAARHELELQQPTNIVKLKEAQ